ncbi:MAG: class I SAM-dependent methyltransferase [Burkholderiales bacterium]|nr:class I SAM-dependent methyltransferase [Burkholderiales bacterium]
MSAARGFWGHWLRAAWRLWQAGKGRRSASRGRQGAAGLDPGLIDVPVHYLARRPYEPTDAERQLKARDGWFYNHCVVAARQVIDALGLSTSADARVLDLGCGDGMMALGVCRSSAALVVGCDVTRAFDVLPAKAAELLDPPAVPDRLQFVQSQVGQPLPFSDGSFDAAYSWSVFEHVDSVAQLMRETLRILRPGACFFLQIEPLYHSPHGSHLRRLLDEPWAHLLHDEQDYLARIAQASSYVDDREKDMLFHRNEFDAVKAYLMGEYRSLNRVRSHELIAQARAAGFTVERCELGQVPAASLPPGLLGRYSAHDLRTNEIRLWLRRPA